MRKKNLIWGTILAVAVLTGGIAQATVNGATVENCDMNYDGSVDVFDLIRVKQYILGSDLDEVKTDKYTTEQVVRIREIEKLLDIPRGTPIEYPAYVPSYIEDLKVSALLHLTSTTLKSELGYDRGFYQHVQVQDEQGTLAVRVNFENELTDEEYKAMGMDVKTQPLGRFINRRSIIMFTPSTEYVKGTWGHYDNNGEFVADDVKLVKAFVIED